ncbi:30S ribosomal protein S1 [Helicobacter canis]|uniref:Ribosomal protein S1 n=1 Tax=Helicobacter canis NCTC 12740 TaxID=1357399 RepID=V8CEJ7_9HELI|nr:30S ribosomal protein S1 [Helicobacter canis]ETD25848.1 ribosomal protein S1 [Helicobacter canis NCTC 12740]
MLKVLDDTEDNGEFARMLAEREKQEELGQVKTGKVIAIHDNGLLVDVGEKIEGFLGLAEVADESGKIPFNVGDEIVVFVSSGKGERPSVSHKKAIKLANVERKIKELGSDFKDKIVEGKIIRKNKGGYVLESDGVDYFMPRAAAALKDSAKNIGQRVKACIIDVRPDERSIIVSRKRFFEIDDAKQAEGVKKLLEEEGKVFEGVVKSITSFGMFVEVDGVKGLVHYTEISHKGPVNTAKLYKEDDRVSVKVVGYDEEKKRLSFSIKAVTQDPWQEVQKELKKGYTIKVVVSNIEAYGAFVDIGNDVEGFLHISELSWDKDIKHPSDILKVGDEIDVEVIEIDPANRRLRVSLKNLLEKPFDNFMKTYKLNDVVKGKVATLTDFGAFISLGQVDGLLHNEDAFWEKNKCKDAFKVGQELEVRIVKIDSANQRISLSRRALEESPAEVFSKTHKVDDIVKGRVIDSKDFGVFIEIDGMDALIRNEDLYPLKKEEIEVGSEIEGVIVAIDKQNNRVRVSVKRLERQKQKEEIRAINSADKMTLGDKLKDKIQRS